MTFCTHEIRNRFSYDSIISALLQFMIDCKNTEFCGAYDLERHTVTTVMLTKSKMSDHFEKTPFMLSHNHFFIPNDQYV